MNEKKGFVFNVGTPSILVIVLTFVLTLFALLSIRASNSEQNLSDKTASSVQEYYTADQKAVYTLAYFDSILEHTDIAYVEQTMIGLEAGKDDRIRGLENTKVVLDDHASFVVGTEGKRRKIGTVSFAYPVRKGARLDVCLKLYNDRSYEITQWSVTQKKADLQQLEDSGTTLWDGVVTEEK